MKETYQKLKTRFDSLSQRERLVVLLSTLLAVIYVWWMAFADPRLQLVNNLQRDITRVESENQVSRALVGQLQQRIDNGVNRSKELELQRLREELVKVSEALESGTRTMIGPEKMFSFMRDLVTRDSGLTLIGLKRLRVEGVLHNHQAPDAGSSEEHLAEVYRHYMEVSFSGSYLDILAYVKTLESAEWRFLWDYIEIAATDYPVIEVTLRLSTLSLQKSWVSV